MRDIKIGEYIRTKDGVIAKVTDILDEYSLDTDNDVFSLEEDRTENFWLNNPSKMMEIPWEYIEMYVKKHSFSKTDLIEEGDYVNGDKIVKIEEDIYIGGLNLWTERDAPDGFGGFYRVKYREKDIKSIVTKEQIKAMEYEVK